jgi:LysM repeat protein
MAAVALGIMGAGVTQAEAHELTHKVQPGESLWGISNKANVSIQELMQINNLSSSTIYAGQELTPYIRSRKITIPPSTS